MSENIYPEFAFPDVEKGEVVLWMASPSDEQAHMMQVVKVGDTTVEGVVWYANEPGDHEPKTGVRHVSDPWLQEPFNLNAMTMEENSGVFIRLPGLDGFRNRIAALEAQVGARDQVIQAMIDRLNQMGDTLPPIPSIAEAVAEVATQRRGRTPRRRSGEPTSPAPTGTRLSSLIG